MGNFVSIMRVYEVIIHEDVRGYYPFITNYTLCV